MRTTAQDSAGHADVVTQSTTRQRSQRSQTSGFVSRSSDESITISVHQTLQISPGALVFGRDMMLPIPLLADYNLIRERCQAVIDENNRKANLRRHFKDYKADDQVLLFIPKRGKPHDTTLGPFRVQEVHVNGTVTIESRSMEQ